MRIERAERLVHQKDFRIADQHLRQADALSLPAGQHVRVARRSSAKADTRSAIMRTLQRICLRRARDLEADRDIFECGLPGNSASDWNRIAGLRG